MITIGWLLLATAMVATACAPQRTSSTLSSGPEPIPAGPYKPDLCLAFKPVHPSKSKDTLETRIEVAHNNAVGASYCGWKP